MMSDRCEEESPATNERLQIVSSNKQAFRCPIQCSTDVVSKKSKISIYHREIEEIHLVRTADSLNVTPDVILMSTFTFLIHRYVYASESIDIIVDQCLWNIPIRNCSFKQILMNIQLAKTNVKLPTEIITDEFVLMLTITKRNHSQRNGMYKFELACSNDSIDEDMACSMIEAYQRLIESVTTIKNLSDLTYDQLISLPLVSSNPSIDGPLDLYISSEVDSHLIYIHFQRIAQIYFDQICLQQKGTRSLSYNDCLLLVDHFSSILQCKLGVKKGTVIGLWMNNSFEYIIAVLSSLKLGAIFVPLDVEHPHDRLEYIRQQANINLILTNRKTFPVTKLNSISSFHPLQIHLTDSGDLEIDNLANHSVSLSESEDEFNGDSGYVIFTSGSSGKPKGVLIEQSSLLNTVLSQIQIFGIKTSDVVAQYASIGFDASLSEIFMALLSGASLVIFCSPLERVGSSFIDVLNYFSVTTITLAPSILASVDPQQLSTLCTVISAGEACPTALAHKWTNENRRFFNAYGPSEAAICTTIYEFDLTRSARSLRSETLPIGRPIHHVRIRVTDSQLNDVPLGMPGELLIGGIGVSQKGYIAPTDKETNMSFVNRNEQRWYRSGDLVQTMICDHQTIVMYLGRIDDQVKLNGCRIDLSEIETVLLGCPGVTHCVVVVHQCIECKDNHRSLAAYIGDDVEEDFIRERLTRKLPSFMLPTYIIVNCSSQLPKTLSNKINRQLLITDENVHSHQQTIDALSLTRKEKQLLDPWNTILNKPNGTDVDILFNSRTFAQCGGSSLKVMQLRALIKRQLSIDISIHAHMSFKQMVNLFIESRDMNENMMYTTIERDLQSSLEDLDRKCLSPKRTEMRSILLTGATGFLGCFLLNELLLRTNMQIVVPVRANSLDEANNRLRSTFLKYDLSIDQIQERLQLHFCANLADDSQSLSFLPWDDIDAILHCAADTNFNMTYEQLQQVNVQWTKSLLEKCFNHGISFYYVSTLSIFLFNHNEDPSFNNIVTECDQPQLRSILGGYSQTKYVAERLVLQSFQRGMHGAIFRPGRITGSSISGRGANEDLFILMLKGCHQLDAYPNLQFPFDLTPVDQVSKAIVNVIIDEPSVSNSSPLIVHLINTNTISFDEQFKLLKQFHCCTKELQTLPYQQWYQRLEQQLFNEQQKTSKISNSLFPLIPFLQSSFWQYVQHWPVFTPTKTCNALINTCPRSLFKLYCDEWKRIHLFD